MNETVILLKIENLMKAAMKRAYHWEDFEIDYYGLLAQARSIYHPDYNYSALVQAYFDLMPERRHADDNDIFDSKFEFKAWQRKLRLRHTDFIATFWSNNNSNRQSLFEHVDDLLDQHCKLLLVRVDLSYPAENNPTIRQFNRDIKKLLNRIQNKDTIFKYQLGYVYRLEQGGKSKTYHCHLLVIFNGSEVCNDGYYAQAIGELWADKITGDEGIFYNCNQKSHKQRYEADNRLGLGMLRYDDDTKLEAAFNTMGYLAKPDKDNQYLRGNLKDMREFGRSQGRRRRTPARSSYRRRRTIDYQKYRLDTYRK